MDKDKVKIDKVKSKMTLINKIIKIFCWLLFVLGIVLISIGIAQFISSIIEINNQSEPNMSSVGEAVAWTKNFSNLVGNVNYYFGFMLSGILLMIIARIISKPLLIGGSIFSWIFEKDVETKKNFKKKAIINIIFLSLSCVLAIITLIGIYQFLFPVTEIVGDAQVIVDNGVITIENLPANSTEVEITEQVDLIVNNVQNFINELDPNSIIKKAFNMFIMFAIGLVSWGIFEMVHGIVVKVKKIK